MDQHEDHVLSDVVIHLLKGILYKEEKPLLWESLVCQEASVRDYLSVIGLDVKIDQNEGFAYVENTEIGDSGEALPRLVARRPLSYPVSLILVLLRRKYAEHDASSGEVRLIMDVSELYDRAGTFFTALNNEVRMRKRFDAYLQRIQELGFIRFLDKGKTKIEVKRILKAFINAQWLAEFETRMKSYSSSYNPTEMEELQDE